MSSASCALCQARAEAAFVGQQRGQAALGGHVGGGRAHPRHHMDGLGHVAGTCRDRQEILHVHATPGVQAATEDVDHRQRQLHRGVAAHLGNPGIQRHAAGGGAGAADGHRDTEDAVGADALELRRAVEFDQALVQALLVHRVHALDGRGDFAIDVGHGLGDTQPAVLAGIAVAQFMRFGAAGRRARGHGGPAGAAVGQFDVDFDGGAAARVQDLARVHMADGGVGHGAGFRWWGVLQG